jgi:CubicO group peptidase (beta-lactamase class C family)
MVSRHGEPIIDLIDGFADKEAGRRLDRDSVYITWSTAKPMTSVLAMSLVERGLLRLHTPVADVLPEFGQLGKQTVTLFHLLTHTSGVVSGFPALAPEVLTNIEKLTAYAASTQLECIPGERVSYSMLVAHSVIAAMCLQVDGRGRNYATMLSEDLLQPLGMTNTSLGPRDDLVARLCPVKLAQQLPESLPLEQFSALVLMPGSEVPAAGMLTTIDDLHRFTEMMRGGGELDGVRILSPATLDYCSRIYTGTMRNSAWDASVAIRHWQAFSANLGIGFHVRGEDVRPGPFGTFNSPRTFGHFGAGSSGTWVDPKYGLGFSLLTTGLIEDSRHMERTAVLSDLVVSALVH